MKKFPLMCEKRRRNSGKRQYSLQILLRDRILLTSFTVWRYKTFAGTVWRYKTFRGIPRYRRYTTIPWRPYPIRLFLRIYDIYLKPENKVIGKRKKLCRKQKKNSDRIEKEWQFRKNAESIQQKIAPWYGFWKRKRESTQIPWMVPTWNLLFFALNESLDHVEELCKARFCTFRKMGPLVKNWLLSKFWRVRVFPRGSCFACFLYSALVKSSLMSAEQITAPSLLEQKIMAQPESENPNSSVDSVGAQNLVPVAPGPMGTQMRPGLFRSPFSSAFVHVFSSLQNSTEDRPQMKAQCLLKDSSFLWFVFRFLVSGSRVRCPCNFPPLCSSFCRVKCHEISRSQMWDKHLVNLERSVMFISFATNRLAWVEASLNFRLSSLGFFHPCRSFLCLKFSQAAVS